MNIFQKMYFFFTGQTNENATALEAEAEMEKFEGKTLTDIVNSQVSEKTAELNTQLEAFKTEMSEATNSLTTFKAQMDELQKSTEAFKLTISTLETEKAELAATIEAKENELTKSLQLISTEQANVKKLETELLEAKSKQLIPAGNELPNRDEVGGVSKPKGAVQFN